MRKLQAAVLIERGLALGHGRPARIRKISSKQKPSTAEAQFDDGADLVRVIPDPQRSTFRAEEIANISLTGGQRTGSDRAITEVQGPFDEGEPAPVIIRPKCLNPLEQRPSPTELGHHTRRVCLSVMAVEFHTEAMPWWVRGILDQRLHTTDATNPWPELGMIDELAHAPVVIEVGVREQQRLDRIVAEVRSEQIVNRKLARAPDPINYQPTRPR